MSSLLRRLRAAVVHWTVHTPGFYEAGCPWCYHKLHKYCGHEPEMRRWL